MLLFLILFFSCLIFVFALPSGPSVSYVVNSSRQSLSTNRSVDVKGTITTLDLDLSQQVYSWKAYVGNVTGALVLDDVNSKSIYDWSVSIAGEVYATRSSSVSWSNVSCVNQSVVSSEQVALGISSSSSYNINNTFNSTVHRNFLVGTKNISNSTCKSVATYVNDAAQSVSENSDFQEVLLRDDLGSFLIYTALINNDKTGYDGSSTFDFQMIVAENESATVPSTYYFYVELG